MYTLSRLIAAFALGLCFATVCRCQASGASAPASSIKDCGCAPSRTADLDLEELFACLRIHGSPLVRSATVEIELDELNKSGAPSGRRNRYSGPIDFSNLQGFRPVSKHTEWRTIPFVWQFNLRGFLEMGTLDPIFNASPNLRVHYDGQEPCDEGLCASYSLVPEVMRGKHADYSFRGSLQVSAEDCKIVQVRGTFVPERDISLKGELFWFPFVTHFGRNSEGYRVPFFTCVLQRKAEFPKPAFKALLIYKYSDVEDHRSEAERSCE